MYLNCMPDIMVLAQAVLKIFMSQDRLTIQNAEVDKGHKSVEYYRILPKVNQVIYTLDTICMPNIMILAQTVL